MAKLLIEIFVPASNQTFDVWIPEKSKLHEVTFLLASTMSELSHGSFLATDKAVLCERNSGEVLNINLSMEELGMIHGSKLMLL